MSIIIRLAFEGPHLLTTTAPSLLAINEAQRQFDMAQQAIAAYVDDKSKGHAITARIVDKTIYLFRSQHDYAGQCRYGDWAALDTLIADILARIVAVEP